MTEHPSHPANTGAEAIAQAMQRIIQDREPGAELAVPAQTRGLEPAQVDHGTDLRSFAGRHLELVQASLAQVHESAVARVEAITREATGELEQVARGNRAAIERDREAVRRAHAQLAEAKDRLSAG